MSTAPIFEIDPAAFKADPYPDLAKMRAAGGIHFVPQLGATLFTRRADIFVCEKNVEVFSSRQPGGLMDVLMGQNMMRKDGAEHAAERKAVFPALSPRTVMDAWRPLFEEAADRVLDGLVAQGSGDLVRAYAMPLSGAALAQITGLTNMAPEELDRVSQGMIDGIANYAGDPAVEANCQDCTASIDRHIDAMKPALQAEPNKSLLSVQMQAGLPDETVRANVKLAISGGQNEPRDAIAGAAFALLSHPDQLARVLAGDVTWRAVFEEYARWVSPIGMSPREIKQDFEWNGMQLEKGQRVFFMFGSANRDEAHFENPDTFDITRNTAKAISFGAGPHFCAGAWASKTLVAEVALPMLFDAFPNMKLKGEVRFGGWAFRGPLKMPVGVTI